MLLGLQAKTAPFSVAEANVRSVIMNGRFVFVVSVVFLLGGVVGFLSSEKLGEREGDDDILSDCQDQLRESIAVSNTMRSCRLGLVDQAALLLLAKNVNGEFPEVGLLDEDYQDLFLLPSRESDIFDRPFLLDKCTVLFSAGFDGEFGTFDDMGVRVESQVVSNMLNEINDDGAVESFYRKELKRLE